MPSLIYNEERKANHRISGSFDNRRSCLSEGIEFNSWQHLSFVEFLSNDPVDFMVDIIWSERMTWILSYDHRLILAVSRRCVRLRRCVRERRTKSDIGYCWYDRDGDRASCLFGRVRSSHSSLSSDESIYLHVHCVNKKSDERKTTENKESDSEMISRSSWRRKEIEAAREKRRPRKESGSFSNASLHGGSDPGIGRTTNLRSHPVPLKTEAYLLASCNSFLYFRLV